MDTSMDELRREAEEYKAYKRAIARKATNKYRAKNREKVREQNTIARRTWLAALPEEARAAMRKRNADLARERRAAMTPEARAEVNKRQSTRPAYVVWQQEHRPARNALIRANRLATKLAIIERLGGACLDCGGKFPPSVYDLHHTNGTKEFAMSALIAMATTDRLEAELAKCVLLCSNCHRIRHNERSHIE